MAGIGRVWPKRNNLRPGGDKAQGRNALTAVCPDIQAEPRNQGRISARRHRPRNSARQGLRPPQPRLARRFRPAPEGQLPDALRQVRVQVVDGGGRQHGAPAVPAGLHGRPVRRGPRSAARLRARAGVAADQPAARRALSPGHAVAQEPCLPQLVLRQPAEAVAPCRRAKDPDQPGRRRHARDRGGRRGARLQRPGQLRRRGGHLSRHDGRHRRGPDGLLGAARRRWARRQRAHRQRRQPPAFADYGHAPTFSDTLVEVAKHAAA